MNTFQLKIDTERNQGLKYQIYTKELIQDPELKTVKEVSNSKKILSGKRKGNNSESLQILMAGE